MPHVAAEILVYARVKSQRLRVTIRPSKTDQEGHGQVIAIVRGGSTCPVKAVKAWLAASGISEGPLFRPVVKGGRLGAGRLTDKSVCDLVKAYAERLGFHPAVFGAHSLRSSFLTSAARRGASVFKMRDVSRVRDAELFRDHAGAGLLCRARLPRSSASATGRQGRLERNAIKVPAKSPSREVVFAFRCVTGRRELIFEGCRKVRWIRAFRGGRCRD
jgi:hypothetical protein